MLFKDKEKRYKKLLIFVIPILVLCLVFAVLTYFSASSLLGGGLGSQNTYDIESLDYHLRSNATEYQVELFKELDTLIKEEADDIKIAESVVKNYIADTYTWDNKEGSWDVGGMWFVHSPSKYSIYIETRDNFYSFLNKYQDQYGKDGLLEVQSIEVTSSHKSDEQYSFNNSLFDCYDIECDWSYTEDSRFAKELEHYQYFKVIKNNDGRFEIVVCFGNVY